MQALAHDQSAIIPLKEAAALLGVSRDAIRMRVRRGQMPARKFGRQYIFLRSEFEAYLQDLPRVGETSKLDARATQSPTRECSR
jgi:excisionase family DNA binding protein